MMYDQDRGVDDRRQSDVRAWCQRNILSFLKAHFDGDTNEAARCNLRPRIWELSIGRSGDVRRYLPILRVFFNPEVKSLAFACAA